MLNNLYKGVEYLRQYQGAKLVRAKTFERIVSKLEACEKAGIELICEKFTCKSCPSYEVCIERFDKLLDVVQGTKKKQVKNIVHW